MVKTKYSNIYDSIKQTNMSYSLNRSKKILYIIVFTVLLHGLLCSEDTQVSQKHNLITLKTFDDSELLSLVINFI